MEQSTFARLRFSNVLPTCESTDFNQMNWHLIKVSGDKGQVIALLDSLRVQYFGVERNAHSADNLFFVKATIGELQQLKERLLHHSPQYLIDNSRDLLATIDGKQVDDFVRIAGSGQAIYMDNLDFASKEGVQVRITDGAFKGVEGKILRVCGNKKVVVCIANVVAVAIGFVPTNYIERIN